MPILTEIDCTKMAKIFPDLNCSEAEQKVWGTLWVKASYHSTLNRLSFSDEQDHFIEDDYEIEIDFSKHNSINNVPIVYERSQIIRSFAESEKMPLLDLHVYDDDSCCLGIFPEYQWQNSVHFIQSKVIPFFYWQSYRRMHGYEPWKALSHGKLGFAEGYCEFITNLKEVNKGCNRNQPCFCGSGKKTKYCCGK